MRESFKGGLIYSEIIRFSLIYYTVCAYLLWSSGEWIRSEVNLSISFTIDKETDQSFQYLIEKSLCFPNSPEIFSFAVIGITILDDRKERNIRVIQYFPALCETVANPHSKISMLYEAPTLSQSVSIENLCQFVTVRFLWKYTFLANRSFKCTS